MKDFLFLHFSWVPTASYIFHAFEKCGYTCDFVTEKDIQNWVPKCKYRVVVAYLHDYAHYVNRIVSEWLPDAFFVQHDDTDFPNIMSYYSRSPDLVFHRELTEQSINPYACTAYPMHFPVPSLYNEQQQEEKLYDVCFLGCPNSPRRNIFIETIQRLAKEELSHLNWFIKHEPTRNWQEFQYVVNKSRIGLNYPGNSWDSLRVWELASAGICIIAPEPQVLSIREPGIEFNQYVKIDMTCNDLADKIQWCLQDDRYKKIGHTIKESYLTNHSPEKCFERYYNRLCKHAGLEIKPVVPWDGMEIWNVWRNDPNHTSS
jgi:hypothetical protein